MEEEEGNKLMKNVTTFVLFGGNGNRWDEYKLENAYKF